MKTVQKQMITADVWLSRIMKRPVFKIELGIDDVDAECEKTIRSLQQGNAFLYSKVPVDQIQRVHFFEHLGFRLADTNILFEKTVQRQRLPMQKVDIRFGKSSDEEEVVKLARSSFTFSRFHQDEQIPKEMANSIKAEWARSFFKRLRGTHMVVATIADKICGFLLLLQKEDSVLSIDLITVDASFRRKGIARAMIEFSEQNCPGIRRLTVGTQLSNYASIKTYENLGFQISSSFYTFHYHASSAI